MKVKDILEKIENGSAHILVFDNEVGEVLANNIWHNEIDEKLLTLDVDTLQVTDYTLRIGVKYDKKRNRKNL